MATVNICNWNMCTDYLTLSNIQQICSRRLWKHLVKNMESLYNRKNNYWVKFKSLWQKEKLHFIILPQCFPMSSAAVASESVYMWERVNRSGRDLIRIPAKCFKVKQGCIQITVTHQALRENIPVFVWCRQSPIVRAYYVKYTNYCERKLRMPP